MRQVKGALFVDYVRMLRGRKDVDWARHLTPRDLRYLGERIGMGDWYPMETFERMGLGILAEIAEGDVERVRFWGRASIDWLVQVYANLIAPGDPRETLMRFQVLRRGFFDYPAVEIVEVTDAHASIEVTYGMGPKAEQAASYQTLGFFERLVEVAGATSVDAGFTARSWAGDATTMIGLRWTM